MKARYYLKGNFPVLVSILILFVVSVCLAEEITLTTYYPSPYGVYSEMRLYPKNSPSMPCDSSEREGLMFYSDGSNALYPRGLYVCGQNPLGGYGWNPIGGLWSRDVTDLYPTDLSWNVGIGKSDPGTKLDVAGTVRATDFTCVDCLGPADIGDGLGVNEIDETVIQRRVSGTCSPDSSIRIINQDGSVICEPDDTGGGPGNVTIGSLTVTGGGGSMSPNPWNPGSGVNAALDIAGGPGGSVFSLAGGSGIALSGPGVSGNTWNPNAGTATINATGNGPGAVTPWFSPEVSVDNGDDMMINLGSPGQFSFCALAKHKENTGGDKDRAECSVKLSGTQWVLWAITRSDADATCGAICF